MECYLRQILEDVDDIIHKGDDQEMISRFEDLAMTGVDTPANLMSDSVSLDTR